MSYDSSNMEIQKGYKTVPLFADPVTYLFMHHTLHNWLFNSILIWIGLAIVKKMPQVILYI